VKNLRTYGRRPFRVAVIHGGPGAPGEMAPVARELASFTGVLEPLQTAASLEGQVRELHTLLKEKGNLPVTLIGWSWGAWLSYIFTVRYPAFVRKLILIGGGPFEEKYALNIMSERLNRLGEEERAEVFSLLETLDSPGTKDKNAPMARFGELMARADAYDPLPHPSELLAYQYDINESVWKDASELRRSGKLLEMGRKIRCPVVAIHGDDDPHPAGGVREPLSRVLKDFRFILLEKCGHEPWVERQARERFYEILKEEV
jgi:pimeloyl-ACP methyl ester carboxylesterase